MPDKEAPGRHPFHPALVHFPVACWVLSHPADVAALIGAKIVFFGLDWWALSSFLIWTGTISALLAMAFGIYDFMQLPDEDKLLQALYRHVGFVVSAWILYLVSGYIRLDGNMLPVAPALLPALISFVGLICLCIGGWYGGQMIYKFHLGAGIHE